MSHRIAFLVVVLVAASAAAQLAAVEEDECPRVCPALYAPLCATSDNKTYSQFSNRCELRAANCQRKRDLIATAKPFVESDAFWCSSELVENLMETLSHLDVNRPDCFRPCPMIYAPVCVSNGEYRAVVSNNCLVDVVNCLVQSSADDAVAPTLFRVLRHGEC